jgi:hypothetical protein
VKKLVGRGSVLGVFAVLGFVAGVAFGFAIPYVVPALAYLPKIVTAQWFLAGLMGALFAVVIVLAYIAVHHN